jgi:hypothetical protein
MPGPPVLRCIASAALLAWCSLATDATAQVILPGAPPPAGPPYAPAPQAAWAPPSFPIEIHADAPGMLVELYAPTAKPRRDLPLLRCVAPCSANVAPGKYRLYVDATEETLRGTSTITLNGPSYVIVTPETPSTRWIGLGLGVAGTLALPTGITLLTVGLVESSTCDEDPSCHQELVAPGLLALVGGLVLAPMGWIMFASSYKPGVEIRPARVIGGSAAPWQMHVGGPAGSHGMRLTLTF